MVNTNSCLHIIFLLKSCWTQSVICLKDCYMLLTFSSTESGAVVCPLACHTWLQSWHSTLKSVMIFLSNHVCCMRLLHIGNSTLNFLGHSSLVAAYTDGLLFTRFDYKYKDIHGRLNLNYENVST